MKKLSYRDKLLELANIYNVKEILEYVKNRKNLTSGQLELILKKNNIVIPKDFKTNFIKENFTKPVAKFKSNFFEFKDERIKDKNRYLRKLENFKHDSKRTFSNSLKVLWRYIGNVGLNFLNIIPKVGNVVYKFFGSVLTDLFNGIYNQQINLKKAKNLVIGLFLIIGISTAILSFNYKFSETNYIKQTELKKPEVQVKKEKKKPEVQVKKEKKKPELKVKRNNVAEVILPDLNLKTKTVLNLFEDVDYDLKQVRNNKLVKPIYFTQFPKDLDELTSVRLKKETFIKIVLPLIVAENEKILADREKLKLVSDKKFTTDIEKQWLRQKLLEYKVKKGDIKELSNRIDIVPTSIALAQAAKESGWGTSRFALEGNAIFGQWTWSGQGIAPLNREGNKNHKILKFPILRASVKAYHNNLNTHKSYRKFREKREILREKNQIVSGLDLTDTLNNYAETGSEYIKILNQIIKQNDLSDFEPVRLVNSIKKIELTS
ncbi:glucosaminidase domain-containing protein [Pelagibacteraceae bacterium]|nr:glucosaminidase domain-containing protein [Pelagibacteraceae bacterium]